MILKGGGAVYNKSEWCLADQIFFAYSRCMRMGVRCSYLDRDGGWTDGAVFVGFVKSLLVYTRFFRLTHVWTYSYVLIVILIHTRLLCC